MPPQVGLLDGRLTPIVKRITCHRGAISSACGWNRENLLAPEARVSRATDSREIFAMTYVSRQGPRCRSGPLPLVIGHRGASAARPENTVEAFRHAAELGADWVELDVRRTADDALVVHHDAELPDGRADRRAGRRRAARRRWPRSTRPWRPAPAWASTSRSRTARRPRLRPRRPGRRRRSPSCCVDAPPPGRSSPTGSWSPRSTRRTIAVVRELGPARADRPALFDRPTDVAGRIERGRRPPATSRRQPVGPVRRRGAHGRRPRRRPARSTRGPSTIPTACGAGRPRGRRHHHQRPRRRPGRRRRVDRGDLRRREGDR